MKGITRRWFIEVVSLIFAILLVTATVLVVILARSYYGTVETTLSSNANDMVTLFFSRYGSTTGEGFAASGREFLEDFTEKDVMEVWIIDSSGKVILSSSGFEVDETEMPDYDEALSSETYKGAWSGKTESGESIMAQTVLVTGTDGVHAGAVRFMISLEGIERQLLKLSLLIYGICFIFFAVLVLISANFFFKSIIRPVKKVCDTAHQIASGDLDARIEEYNSDDEIGQLCKTINDMASELEAADEMKNDFISTVSHELRTPLTAIKGWGETLLQLGDADPAMTRRGMEIIIDETTRLNDMVEELLDFSRMNNGKLSLNNERIDVLAELDEAVFTFRERAVKEGIEVTYNVPHVPIPAFGDAARIRQVFVNILDNAIKYNQQGGKLIVKAELIDSDKLMIAFTDTGKGISEDDLPKVKEKFYKADSTVRGSGIGLAVVDEIVKLHNGEFSIDSVLGEGTTVTVIFPVDVTGKEGEKKVNEEE